MPVGDGLKIPALNDVVFTEHNNIMIRTGKSTLIIIIVCHPFFLVPSVSTFHQGMYSWVEPIRVRYQPIVLFLASSFFIFCENLRTKDSP